MSLMTNKQNEKYSLYLGKVRDRIGGHSYHQNLNQTLWQTKNPQMNSENFSKNL